VQETNRYRNITEKLVQRTDDQLLRTLQPVSFEESKERVSIDGRVFLNFSSNDYLGLSMNPELIERSIEYTRRYGTSSSASRLISGSLTIHHQLEEKIAVLCSSEDCILFGSGFLANTTILPALAGRGDLILADKHIHNSIIQGGLLSRASFRRFRHNDCNHLENLLKRHRAGSGNDCWVVTESLFSMDGDLAPIDEIAGLCKKFGAFLMVDDAHSFGVWGEKGLGITSGRDDIDLKLGTLGKAGGGYGAFALCSKIIKEYLVNYCAGIIYSTSPTPGAIGAADAAFDLIPRMENSRILLKRNINYLTDGLKLMRRERPDATRPTQIIPILLDDEAEALSVAAMLFEAGIFVQPIRPPTVDRSRLRVTLSALHSKEDIDCLLEGLTYD